MTPAARQARTKLRSWRVRRETAEAKLKQLLDVDLAALVKQAQEAGLTLVEISEVAGVNRSTLYAKDPQHD